MAATLTPPQIHEPSSHSIPSATVGGRFDFDDGGVYVGGWQDSKAHGHGVCTGPKSQGEYSGSWCYGFELSGVYKWPSGATYEGQWQNGKRHGLGVEYRGKWVYKGEWTQGYKGRYGTRSSLMSAAKYEGTWANGLQDGYGSETYADGGTYQGQWLRGTRHGYGVRQSAAFGHCNITKAALLKNSSKNASLHSLDTEGEGTLVDHKRDAAMRGGFILVVRSTCKKRRNSLVDTTRSTFFRGLRIRKQRSTGDLDQRSGRSSASAGRSSSTESGISGSHRGDNELGDAISNASFLTDEGDIQDPTTTETYMGEWKNDKRCGFGICERSDGIRYEGEWYNNKKYGYGVTTMRDGYREEGKYKNNVLVTNMKKKHLFAIRSSKTRERIEAAVQASRRSQEIALQKADIAISRTATARGKAEQADVAAVVGRQDSQLAFTTGKQYGGAEASAFPDVPLRRKMSSVDFSGGMSRRQTKENIHLLTAQGASNSLAPDVNTMPKSSQLLNPSMPFGGRRGSFRNLNDSLHQQHTGSQLQQPSSQLLPPSSSMSLSPNQQLPPHMQINQLHQQSYQQQQHHQQQPIQLNVPSLSFEPATPDPGPQFPQMPQQQQQSQQPPPSRPLRPSLKSQSSPYNQQQQQMQQQPADPRTQYSLQYQQQQEQQPQRPADPRMSAREFYQLQQQQQQQQQFEQMRLQQEQQLQMEADRIRRQQFSQQHQQMQQQLQQEQHMSQQQALQQQMQQQQQYQMQQQQLNNNQSFPQHQQTRRMTLQQQQPQNYNPYQQRVEANQPFTDHFDHYSALVNRYANQAKQLPGKKRSKAPISSENAFANVRSRDSVASGSSTKVINPGTDSVRSSVVFDDLGFPTNKGKSDAISYASSLVDGIGSPKNSGPVRTSSLIRPAAPTGVTGLKRKPSIQTATLKAAQPAMSREEVAAMSHAQRLYNRSEADMAVRMRSNPLLFLVNPRFTEWLNRQKLILLILILNISLAVVFYQLFG